MLENISLFKGLPQEQLHALESACTVRTYPKNVILFMEGDEHTNFYIIKSGKICVYANDAEGKQVILNHMSAGESFGELALLDNQPRSASIMTIQKCEFAILSKSDFHRILLSDAQACLQIMAELANRIRHLTENVKSLALSDVYGRVRKVLLNAADDSNSIIDPKLTHQDIAYMVGSSREMVSKIMKELTVGGYIESAAKKITLCKALPKEW